MNQEHIAQQCAEHDTTVPSRAEAEAAVRTLIAWAGDNPCRSGLLETPQRVVDAYKEFFAGPAIFSAIDNDIDGGQKAC